MGWCNGALVRGVGSYAKADEGVGGIEKEGGSGEVLDGDIGVEMDGRGICQGRMAMVVPMVSRTCLYELAVGRKR